MTVETRWVQIQLDFLSKTQHNKSDALRLACRKYADLQSLLREARDCLEAIQVSEDATLSEILDRDWRNPSEGLYQDLLFRIDTELEEEKS